MFKPALRSLLFVTLFLSASASWSGEKSHEIKDLFDTIRGQVVKFIYKEDSENPEISKYASESQCDASAADLDAILDGLSAEWRSSRPKNLEAEIPKACMVPIGHLTKKFCPTEARVQFEFNFFIDATDCYDVSQKQILPYLYNFEPPIATAFDKNFMTNKERSSCQRLETLFQVLEDSPFKTQLLSYTSAISQYALTHKNILATNKGRKNKSLSEEEQIRLSIASMMAIPSPTELKAPNKRLPASKKSHNAKSLMDEKTKLWFETSKTTEAKLQSLFGNGVCALSPEF